MQQMVLHSWVSQNIIILQLLYCVPRPARSVHEAYMYDIDPQVVEGNDVNEMNRLLS